MLSLGATIMAIRKGISKPGLLAIGFMAACLPTAALAAEDQVQDQTQTQAQDRTQASAPVERSIAIEDVTVTARRRSENLQQVPLTIAAYGGQELQQRGSTSLNDIAQLTPGLNFESYANGGYPVLTIRGLSQTNITGFENNVSTFYGGIYLPRNYMVDVGLVNLERVEVVKGPQSALYGRNAFAGAINYVLQEPSAKLNADLQLTVGIDGRLDGGGTLGTGLLNGSVKILVGALHTQFDGTWHNSRPGVNTGVSNGSNGLLGGYDNNTYFATVALDPTSRLHMTLNYVRAEKDTEAQGRFNISRNTGDTNCSNIGGVYQFFCGEIKPRAANLDPRSQGLHATTDFFRAAIDYTLSDQLTAHYLFGQVNTDAYSFDQTSINSVSGDSAAGVQFLGLPIGSNRSTSNEFHLDWAHEGTRISVGAFHSNTDDIALIDLAFRPPNALDPIEPYSGSRIVVQNYQTEVSTSSIFGQASQDVDGDKFNISAEGRYTWDHKAQYDLLALVNSAATFRFFTPRVVGKWNISPDNNVYVSAAKGEKSGGFNSGNILAGERLFTPESNWTYELGSKNTFLNRRVQFNADVFYTDWSDLQTNSSSANPAFLGTITRNVGSAKIYGVEFDARVVVTRGLVAGVSATYTHPNYGKNIVDPRFLLQTTATGARIPTVCDGIVCPVNGSIGGNILPRESRYQANGTLRYDGELSGGIKYWIGGDISYKSRQYIDPLLLTYVPDRTLTNLNIGVAVGKFNVEAFVHNLFNTAYVSSVSYNLGTNNIRYEAVLGELRTAGVTLRFKY